MANGIMNNQMNIGLSNQLKFKLVQNGKVVDDLEIPAKTIQNVNDPSLVFEVYEGYKKIGRYKIDSIKVKFL